MTTFAEHVDDYLRLRRGLGFKLEEHARLLRELAAHIDAIGPEVVTIDLALGWALEPVVPAGSVRPAMRLLVVRGFARYLAGIDPRTEVEAVRPSVCEAGVMMVSRGCGLRSGS
jgi:integrase/recombinase XerD